MPKILLTCLIFLFGLSFLLEEPFNLDSKALAYNILNESVHQQDSTGSFSEEISSEPIFTSQEITATLPQGSFKFPLANYELKDKTEIKFYIQEAQSVEFYLRRPESLIEVYLGQAVATQADNWVLLWDTTLTPNGTYHLIAKVTSKYGVYEAGDIIVYVLNPPEESDVKIKQDIEEKFKEIENETKQIQEKEKLIKKEVEEKVEELVKTQAQFLEDEKEKKKEFEEKAKVISEKLKRAVEARDKEEVTRLEQDLPGEVEKLAKPVEEALEAKESIKEFKTRTQQELEKIIEKIKEVSQEKQEIVKKRQGLEIKDSDGDGLPDFEELRIGTDPLNSDTDNDGFTDAIEFASGFDPLNVSPADKIQYQDPRKVEIKPSSQLKIEKIETVQLKSGQPGLKLSGKASPLSFVTLYIFSLPIVVVTKADVQGNWEYILDKPLSDGEHIAYVAFTNNRGEIKEKSEGLAFIKSGKNIIQLTTPASKSEVSSPAETLQRSFLILTVGIIVFAVGLALIIVSLVTSKRNF